MRRHFPSEWRPGSKDPPPRHLYTSFRPLFPDKVIHSSDLCFFFPSLLLPSPIPETLTSSDHSRKNGMKSLSFLDKALVSAPPFLLAFFVCLSFSVRDNKFLRTINGVWYGLSFFCGFRDLPASILFSPSPLPPAWSPAARLSPLKGGFSFRI